MVNPEGFVPESRIITIVGHYGSGKSELAINLALLFAAINNDKSLYFDSSNLETSKGGGSKESAPIYLADLDIVNPYFRSREQGAYLEERGIQIICSAEDYPNVDLPYMPVSMLSIFQDEKAKAVIDGGGDPAGARVLARYNGELRKAKASVLFVLNGNRPYTKDKDATIKCLRDIEAASDLRITGIVNNTHYLNRTELDDIVSGSRLAREVSLETGIPIAFHTVERRLLSIMESNSDEILAEINPVLPINIHLRKPWEL